MFPNHHELDNAQVMDGQLLEAHSDPTSFLEPSDAALDDVATAIGDAIKGERSTTSNPPVGGACLRRDDRPYVMRSQPPTDEGNVVPFVPCHHVGAPARTTTSSCLRRALDRREHRCCIAGLLRLPGTHLHGQGQASPVGDQVQLRGEPTTATPERVIRGLGQVASAVREGQVFSPRPRRVYARGRWNRQYTRASSRSAPGHPAHAGAAGGFGPRARCESIVGSGCTRSATARSARADRATARQCAASRASHSG